METDCIILSKQPYRESALLAGAISPDAGRLDFVAHGAQSVSGKKFPVIDLFQELSIEYSSSEKSSLGTLVSAELKRDFSGLAEHPRHLLFAGKIARFLLDNTQPDLPLPLTFDTFEHVLSHLTGQEEIPWSLTQAAVLFKAVFLYENGLLPEAEGSRGEFLEQLMDAGINNDPLPDCRPEYWTTLNGWLDRLIAYHHLKKQP